MLQTTIVKRDSSSFGCNDLVEVSIPEPMTPPYWGLCFTAVVDGSSVTLSTNAEGTYKVTRNGTDWQDYTLGERIYLANKGDRVFFAARTSNPIVTGDIKDYFLMSGKVSASGNVMSLMNCDSKLEEVPDYGFTNLFTNCKSLVKAPDLPATVLGLMSYGGMFYGCTSLVTSPELPATIIGKNVYSSMFAGCTSLENAPELPIKNLTGSCYSNMFQGCTSLKKYRGLMAETLSLSSISTMFSGCSNLSEVEVRFTTTLARAKSRSWLDGVSPTGVFHCQPSLDTESITRGPDTIPVGWTIIKDVT